MHIVIISDTHNQLNSINLPEGDILIHCGDLTMGGSLNEISKISSQFKRLLNKYNFIIFIAGNHDAGFQIHPETARNFFKDPDIHYLEKSFVIINDIKFYGSPYSPEFFQWNFMYDRNKAKEQWVDIPDDTDVVITHGPPYGVMDHVAPWGHYDSPHAGCPALLDKINAVKPKLHCFGHIHKHHGVKKGDHTLFVNAAICNDAYHTVYKPIVIDTETWKVI